mmetsp:Transcript_5066/g.7339  ORF Transcript_5066/g.7339 Transcript_5066/m.7339 type:complete len:84 (+) Transcript_5066:435-686(+)
MWHKTLTHNTSTLLARCSFTFPSVRICLAEIDNNRTTSLNELQCELDLFSPSSNVAHDVFLKGSSNLAIWPISGVQLLMCVIF